MSRSIGESIASRGLCYLRTERMRPQSSVPSFRTAIVVPKQVLTVDERRTGSWKIGLHFVVRPPPYDPVSQVDTTVRWRNDQDMALLVLPEARKTHSWKQW